MLTLDFTTVTTRSNDRDYILYRNVEKYSLNFFAKIVQSMLHHESFERVKGGEIRTMNNK